MTSGTASALRWTGPRRTRIGAVVAGGFPGSKKTEVLPLINFGTWVLEERYEHSRSRPTGHSGGGGRGAGQESGDWKDGFWQRYSPGGLHN